MPIIEWCPQTLIKSLSNTCQPEVDFLHPWAVRFGSNSRPIICIREKTLSNTNLYVSRHIITEKVSLLVDVHCSKMSKLLKLPNAKCVQLSFH